MAKVRIFLSHISEEVALASIFKNAIESDFLDLPEVFVSSDTVSIATGQNWLTELERAINDASSLLVLSSPASITRPWVNFEIGAAWNRKIPIVPICHSGLLPADLPIPLNLLQAVEARDENGLSRLYRHIADLVGGKAPVKQFDALKAEVMGFEEDYSSTLDLNQGQEVSVPKEVRRRIYEALRDPQHEWRTIERLSILGGVTEEVVLEVLRQDSAIRFGERPDDGKRMAQIKKSEA